PSLFEAQRAQQFFQFSLQSSSPLRLAVRSEYLFRATDNETLHWQIEQNGRRIAAGEQPLMIAPEGEVVLELGELPLLTGELWLNVAVIQPHATPWSDKNHRVAWEQWRLPSLLAEPERTMDLSAPVLDRSDTAIAITHGQQRWQFCPQRGELEQWQIDGVSQLL
ncbi:beta-galactosidase domain 4-containing protein, partial [Kalamiella sp. sgz302252]|uniref:beta-galactosidase domain 4-containing protein n=1 Tax=Pantoea sp. sgz302252 TaxID=3341827 RepID=UPI0036D403C2